jgi:glycosyltransferase involved in cell wall biosynthesis
MQPTLSIITPVYNGASFIGSCIENVIAQNCPQAEHIILDACSTDNTVEIIRSYAERYPHIRWISEKDKGQSDAMNKGITLARGTILSFLNVDDFYEPGVLNRALEVFETLPEPAFVAGNCKVLDEQDHLLFMNRPTALRLQDIILNPVVNPWPINPSAYFYHKSIHDRAGLYDINEHYALDVEFILRAVQVAHLKYVDETWGNFRFIEGTKTFSDTATGSNVNRFQSVLTKYRKDLPPHVQKFFGLYRGLVLIRHWLGYSKNPGLFFTVLMAKIRRRIS